ncbi:MAG: IS66 family insertion sequence element accessory protein TnpB, partial [Proteobacteria bacterium]|nr:IS66 family insertion sequence element accessory protein TnpB [Pseudomonadota bacterium]MBU1612027.1 IS66 family insertion sequence element accessory protein TnpB [Pseudomonadota bacterium]
WADHITVWTQGGLSQSEYCRRHGLAVSTFRYWRSKFGEQSSQRGPASSADTANPAAIVPVPMHTGVIRWPAGGAQDQAPLQIAVGNRYRIEVHGDFAPALLGKVVRTLERLG